MDFFESNKEGRLIWSIVYIVIKDMGVFDIFLVFMDGFVIWIKNLNGLEF